MKKCDSLKFGETIVNKQNLNFIKKMIYNLGIISANIAEVGVYKGGSAMVIANAMNKNSKLHLFDTFSGMPEKSIYDNHHNVGDFYDTSYDEILKLFSNYPNVNIYKGIFPVETGKYINDIKFDLVHIDVDQYLSHKLSLDFFYDKMNIGGYFIFDDYNSPYCHGATKAIDEFFSNKRENVMDTGENVYFSIKK